MSTRMARKVRAQCESAPAATTARRIAPLVAHLPECARSRPLMPTEMESP